MAIMARLLDQILVIDVESTCWEGNPPEGQVSEIIQIGLCPFDVRLLRRLDKRSLMIRPVRSEITKFCTDLTGLTPEMFADAMTFPDALRVLKNEYQSKDRLWASWVRASQQGHIECRQRIADALGGNDQPIFHRQERVPKGRPEPT